MTRPPDRIPDGRSESEIRVEQLPLEIRETNRAVLWKKERRNGRATKVPYVPGRPTERTKVSDPSTWGPFQTALGDVNDGKCDGLGIVLGDGLVGVDLDECRDPGTGVIETWALDIVGDLDSYTEISPSGTGLHIIANGELPPGRRRKGHIEMYSESRYFTVTGEHLDGTPRTIEERSAVLAAVHGRIFGENRERANPGTEPPPISDQDDAALLELARNARNGTKFAALWAGDTSGYDSPSETDLALCNLLAFWTGGDAARIDRLFRQSELMREKWEREDYRDGTIEKAIETAPARGSDRRPTILIYQELNAVTDEAIQALVARPDLGVYVRSGILVTVARDGTKSDRWLRRPPGAPVIVPIEQARMLGILDDAARWALPPTRNKPPKAKLPPEWVGKQIRGRLEWPFPYLDAVIEAPTLRPDGSILAEAGWDEATGLLYEPIPGAEWPTVPEVPTASDVRQAVETLLDPVQNFPFVEESDRAAYVSAVFSIGGRHLIDGPVPGFPIRSPTPGTGKTLLADVIGIIGTGRVPAAMSMTYQSEEFRKRILALAVDGTPLVLLENLSGSLGSDVLAAALTATEWKDRILGRTEMVSAPLKAVWLMTGNNLGFQRTLGRRVVPIDLDAKVETPEDRTGFQYPDLQAHVCEHRPELVMAALTLLRAFHLAGRPQHGNAPMGSFEGWDDLVRSAVIWAGLDDPATTDESRGRGRIRAQADDDLEGLGALLESLHDLYPNSRPFSTAEVIRKARDNDNLSTALDMVAAPPRGGHANARSVGGAFRGQKDRPIGGLVLRRLRRTWTVEVFTPF